MNKGEHVIDWKLANDDNISSYDIMTDDLISRIHIPVDAIVCNVPSCINHSSSIETFYNDITKALSISIETCIPFCKQGVNHNIPGWNDHVKDQHNMARDTFLSWVSDGKPRQGSVHNNMSITRARFKYALRNCRSMEETARADAMANDLNSKDCTSFWKEVKKVNFNKIPLPNKMGDVTGEHEISKVWKEHYCTFVKFC